MQARCIQECFHGPKAIKYYPDGGPAGDGFYDDIDPLDPISQYFEFPKGTKKYVKVLGKTPTKKDPVGTQNVVKTVIVGQEHKDA